MNLLKKMFNEKIIFDSKKVELFKTPHKTQKCLMIV